MALIRACASSGWVRNDSEGGARLAARGIDVIANFLASNRMLK